jgi:hypothetical protein
LVFAAGDPTGADAENGAPSRSAPEGGLDRLYHPPFQAHPAVPDHSTLRRRAEKLDVPQLRSGTSIGTPSVHLLMDSTGLKPCGAGDWLVGKHGMKTRRSWRNLHIGMDANTGEIVVAALTNDVDDASQVGPLLDQMEGVVASFKGDGAYDQDSVYRVIIDRDPETTIIVPPRSTAVPSVMAETAPTQRDRHLQRIFEKGRLGLQKASAYNKGSRRSRPRTLRAGNRRRVALARGYAAEH